MSGFGPGTGDSGSSSDEYLSYVALLTQSGANAPVATILKNTIGNIVWSRTNGGEYRATLVGAFPATKTWLSFNNLQWDGMYQGYFARNDNDVLTLLIGAGDDFLTSDVPAMIEIRVYS